MKDFWVGGSTPPKERWAARGAVEFEQRADSIMRYVSTGHRIARWQHHTLGQYRTSHAVPFWTSHSGHGSMTLYVNSRYGLACACR
eukprot:1191849-Rhodomonas_salina.2